MEWLTATGRAAARMRVNPVDEPNVQESKDRTKALLARYAQAGRFPDEGSPAWSEGELAVYGTTGPGQRGSLAQCLGDFFTRLRPSDYLALLSFLPRTSALDSAMAALRRRLGDRLGRATMLGFGPRYLHSMGQLFKGGPNRGVFIQITSDDPTDVLIPSAHYSFGILKKAQALGDFHALCRHSRRVIRCHLHGNPLESLKKLNAHFDAVI